MEYTKKEIKDIVTKSFANYALKYGDFPRSANCIIKWNDEDSVRNGYDIALGDWTDEEEDRENIFFHCQTLTDFINLFYDDNGEDFKVISFSL